DLVSGVLTAETGVPTPLVLVNGLAATSLFFNQWPGQADATNFATLITNNIVPGASGVPLLGYVNLPSLTLNLGTILQTLTQTAPPMMTTADTARASNAPTGECENTSCIGYAAFFNGPSIGKKYWNSYSPNQSFYQSLGFHYSAQSYISQNNIKNQNGICSSACW